ncbi:MAG: right-handed parallel beta-helix repeat-containing protein [Bacteroidales bacterium]|nr:right-handed parallel beta-helix repeat-containing protein [Bacteroidales bacterium]
MKKSLTKIFIRVLVAVLLILTPQMSAIDIWVSPAGSDSGPGTEEQPVLTVDAALRRARELRRLKDPRVNGGIRIILKEGTYPLYEPILIRPEDSGTESSPTLIMTEPEGQAVISGGVHVRNWKRAGRNLKGFPEVSRGNLWVADAPSIGGRPFEFRQIWINGSKGQRAGTLGDGALPRILGLDREREEFFIPVPDFDPRENGGLEFVIHQWWAIAILRVKEIIREDGMARITFHQPESKIEFEHPWPAPFIDKGDTLNGNSAFYFVNAPGLLNRPGEWFMDPEKDKVYYWPREGEKLNEAEVIASRLEQLIIISGAPDNPVRHISFSGLDFQHTTWIRPARLGHVPIQAGMSLLDAYKLKTPGTEDKAGLENQAWIERQTAAVEVQNAENIIFSRCNFTRLAATGLDFFEGVNHCNVTGCRFRDIGGTAIQAGFFGNSATEIHLPYDPEDEREVCHHIRISNNLITDCTNEDWGCVGISIGYAHHIQIEYNEVSHLNYSGICVGWGWTSTLSCMRNNLVHANHIHHFARNMYDVGGIYTLSAQPGTVISHNSIHHLEKAPYAHLPEHYQYIYLDEGSSYIRVLNNWTEKDKFFSNTPGPGNIWKNNGPQVSEEIREAAGLQPEFRDLLTEPD